MVCPSLFCPPTSQEEIQCLVIGMTNGANTLTTGRERDAAENGLNELQPHEKHSLSSTSSHTVPTHLMAVEHLPFWIQMRSAITPGSLSFTAWSRFRASRP